MELRMQAKVFTELQNKGQDFLKKWTMKLSKLKVVLKPTLLTFLAFVISATPVMHGYYPFAVAIVCSVGTSPINSMLVLGGSIVGLLMTGSAYSLKYIVAVILVYLFKILWNIFTFQKPTPFVSALFSMLSLGSISLLWTLLDGFLTYDVIFTVIETALAFACTYVYCISARALNVKNPFLPKSMREIVCITATVCTLLLSLNLVNPFGITLGRVLAVYLVLSVALSGGAPAGAMAGAIAGFTLSLYGGNVSYIVGAYALGGLCAGTFKELGKFWGVLIFALTNALVTLYLNFSTEILINFYEIAVAGLLCLLTPKKFFEKARSIITPRTPDSQPIGLNEFIPDRLDKLQDTFNKVGDIFGELMERLSQMPTPRDSIKLSTEDVCVSCSNYNKCFEQNKDITLPAIEVLRRVAMQKSELETSDFPVEFFKQCLRPKVLLETANQVRKSDIRKITKAGEMQNAQNLLKEQYSALCSAIIETINTNVCDKSVNVFISEQVRAALNGLNLPPRRATYLLWGDKTKHFILEIELEGQLNSKKIDQITDEICTVLERNDIDVSCEFADGKTQLKLVDKPPFRLDYTTLTFPKDGETFCGDSGCCFFSDSHFVALLSDGMGSGKNAAIDSNSAVSGAKTFIKGGVAPKNTVRLLNTLLYSKSANESFATLDMLLFNLYTGDCEILKSGSADSFIFTKSGINIAKCDCPPIGIFDKAESKNFSYNLSDGDIVVLVSDGVLNMNESNGIEKIIQIHRNSGTNELAQEIFSYSKALHLEKPKDDISVIVIKVQDNVQVETEK